VGHLGGVINGRNVWRANLAKLVPTLKALKEKLGERLWVASSCSLLHSPVDLTLEHELDPQTRSWFAFALQKCYELGLLADYLDGGELDKITAYSQPIVDRESDSRVHKKAVQSRLASLTNSDFDRQSAYPVRADAQRSDLKLPLFRPPPSAPSRRPLKSGCCARIGVPGASMTRPTRRASRPRSRMPSSARRPSGWTCWCTARPSATTWWSISGAAGRLCHHPLWLGTELWLPLRQAAGDHP
jgi:hypothetical protein